MSKQQNIGLNMYLMLCLKCKLFFLSLCLQQAHVSGSDCTSTHHCRTPTITITFASCTGMYDNRWVLAVWWL